MRFQTAMKLCVLFVFLVQSFYVNAQVDDCSNNNLKIQVLGSGGPELSKNRASSSYLVWQDGKAIIMIDAGGGSAFRYGQSDAQWQDLKVLLFTHFHADHSADLPALVKASWFGSRTNDLLVFGPYGNKKMPSTKEFLDALFGENIGAYKYLSSNYDRKSHEYKLIAKVIEDKKAVQVLFDDDGLKIMAVQVEHGPLPAFAYIVKSCGKTIVFSGDTNGKGFENLSISKTDVFVAHNVVPEDASKRAKYMHMTPSQIGENAVLLHTQKLILSHRMRGTLGKETQTLELIRKNYKGLVEIANDLDFFSLDK